MSSFFELFLTNLTQGVALLDPDLRIVLVNDRLSELLQIPKLATGADTMFIAGLMPIREQAKWLTHLSSFV